ncbi:hypothetical protein SUGI_0131140 [Cryptomeria japonica]|uniref:uncharacterized protein LOC131037112 n=1 Tax=Cryptomeria japonica TaxID=3369 RepID=UPI002408DC44|nr:uncharacterized protein LOC131037112 [Cryptomeria japonica]GLJ10584.1 hypothetical protein SUGI_0131140 [Cryptomeria japonica]
MASTSSSSSTSTEFGTAFEGVSQAYPSASSSKPWDVFINHYGKDVKHTFAASIFNTLDRTGLRVFLDKHGIENGDIIPTEIEEAMRSVSVHIAIFSPNYARSPWCLAELSFMLKTKAKIIPVFYHVDPSDLRWVAQGKGEYAPAFSDYEEKGRYTSVKLKEWKMALETISMHSGCVVTDNFDEGEVLKEIANIVLKTTGKAPLDVAKHPVGLDSMVQELERYIVMSAQSESKVQIVGIVGVEGVGKTTLAKELYNQKCSSFRHTSFIFNVRDAASQRIIHKKQKKLLMDIGFKNQDSFFDNIEEGKVILGSRLKSSSVLIVLDDVSHGDQLDALLPKSPRDLLGSPSLIIVTSRELKVLTKWGIPSNAIYEMKGLDESHAEHLLCQHAFLEPHPKEGYEDLVREYLIECRGLPLSLKEHGEEVYKKSMDDIEWERKLPPLYHKILSRAIPHKRYWFKEDIYDALCNSIQIEEGNQSIWLDQSTGKIGLNTSARSLTIKHGDDDRYWQWVSTDESRFGQVKELIEVWFFHVYHRFECTLLSPNTEYTVAFVVKIDQSRVHSHQSPFEFCLQTIEGNLIQSARFLDDLERSVESHGEFSMTPLINAEDGWMEFVVGEFFLKEDDGSRQARVVDVFMKNQNCNFSKSGIFLDGLKIAPKTINKSGEQVYKKSMDESAAHMGNHCPTSKVVKIANSYASASDIKWESKLPPNYHKILSRAVIHKDYSSIEEIYLALCNSIEIEKGKQIVWLDKSTGTIGLKASASSMGITHGNDIEKWRWVPTEESSFGQVKELIQEWYSKVYARIECTLLSPNTEYTVALLLKIDKTRMHSQLSPFEFSLETIEGNLIQSARFLDDLEKPVESHGGFNKTPVKYAQNGWMEFVVGEFFLKEDGSGRARVIDVLMKNENSNFTKSGIFLDGVRITPK